MSSTIFVALQCCQCSTMQVKQRKKGNNNKWTCVVCNQKQSVMNVFAQGSMAKDVRKFVQSFNMSRKFSDQNQTLSEERDDMKGKMGADLEEEENQKQRKRRTDWTEYLEREDEENQKQMEMEKKRRSDWTQYLEPEEEENQKERKTEEKENHVEIKRRTDWTEYLVEEEEKQG